ncbi:AAA family ATPase [Pelagicoccus sp. SDUM812002]|uniref:ATP-dependent nuclease n=1 Tax=Pelagicoccus sp. SDUM812002 TaxID=3041266 RepID=UPI0028103CA9|nr:AAA family ATPase [Pelagicoccus sp. SDUM812002]MDQ8188479.1 AAA family ATPase [Pelagicoccus sp. SDUM812002]
MAKIEIKQLNIKNFRGFKDLVWNPSSGFNLIIGGGDSGKTTILEAIAMLFHPGSSLTLTEADYFERKTEAGFSIEAVVEVKDGFEFSSGTKTFWPWEWDGENAIQPTGEPEDIPVLQIPVFRVLLTATADFDLSWEILQPDETTNHFPVGLRRSIGVVKLTSDDKNDRDLRLVYGSALDRLLSDENLRSTVTQAISQVPLTEQLGEESKKSLENLDKLLDEAFLPSSVSLGLTGSSGISIGALVGLFAQKGDLALPLSSWGAGTRRMASLQIATAKQTDAKIAVIDEIERGLEPYRLRQFSRNLLAADEQCFVTTHSPIAISCLTAGQLWYLDSQSNIGKLDMAKIKQQLVRDPETFLSRVSVIVEGETEQGFVAEILQRLFGGDPLDAGVRVCNGQGDNQLLGLLEALESARLVFCGFADRDSGNFGRWDALKELMGTRLFQWGRGCIESNLLPLIPADKLERLFCETDGTQLGYRLRTIADRLAIEEKSLEDILAALEGDREQLRGHIIKAAIGDTAAVSGVNEDERKANQKAWKKHSKDWFKKADGSGGRELLLHLEQTGVWSQVEPELRPFFNQILQLVGKPAVAKINL